MVPDAQGPFEPINRDFNRRITRRRAIKSLALGAAAGITSGYWGCSRSTPSVRRRPNILLIIGDDHRWDTLGCLGHPFARTPNLDRLAVQGALMENYFATTSLCAPSRASILTSMHAHEHQVEDNSRANFGAGLFTFPRLLQEAGYDTAFVGKWHIGNSEAKPGFDYWLSFPGQGDYFGCELIENDRRFKSQGHITDVLTDYAVSWLNQRSEKPFCLVLAHKAAHFPFKPAPRHQQLFEGQVVPAPASFVDTLESKPAWQRAAVSRAWHKSNPQGVYHQPVPDRIEPREWNPENMQSGWLGYYRVICGMDEGIGKVLEVLNDQHKLDDTAIFFTGDNGLLRGEHRRVEKRCMYEESIRLPLLVRYPPVVRPGARIKSLTLNIDLAPTILELAGVAIRPEMRGRSLKPLLEDSSAAWRQSFLYQYHWERGFTIPTTLGVRTERWSLATYPEISDLDELYDIQADPHQMINLATDAAYRADLEQLRQLIRSEGVAVNYPAT